jgi:hypothetical protein
VPRAAVRTLHTRDRVLADSAAFTTQVIRENKYVFSVSRI